MTALNCQLTIPFQLPYKPSKKCIHANNCAGRLIMSHVVPSGSTLYLALLQRPPITRPIELKGILNTVLILFSCFNVQQDYQDERNNLYYLKFPIPHFSNCKTTFSRFFFVINTLMDVNNED